MLDFLTKQPQNIIVVGDYFVNPSTMEDAIRSSLIKCGKVTQVFWGKDDAQIYSQMQLNVEIKGPEGERYPEELNHLIEDADILLTHYSPVPHSLIEKGKNLKAIFTCRGGVEHICMEAASKRNIPVINVIRNIEPVADFCLGLIIDLTRNISVSHHQLIDGNWVKEFPNSKFTTTLSELTVGIVGLGNIGIAVANRLKALGIKLIGHSNHVNMEHLNKIGLGDIEMMSLEDLFSKADVISLHMRLTNDNFGIINKKYFSLMKPTAYFINTSRGGLVNQDDLIEVLRNNSIAGAALDVYDKEPVTPETGFIGLDNIVLTPHIGGATVDAIPKSPYMLMSEVNKVITLGITDRIVNFNKLRNKNK